MTLPSTMPAVVLNGKEDLTVEELPVPAPGPGEVLVEVSHCGVCGSDLHMVIDGWGRKGSVEGHWELLQGASFKQAGDADSDFSLTQAEKGSWQLSPF